jgi:hypothetical protein
LQRQEVEPLARMGRGGKDASLEVFETQLKKLLHIIDKLPKLDQEKAVNILKISANHYSDLTVAQPVLQEPVVAGLAAAQPYCTGLEAEQHYYTATSASFPAYPAPATAGSRLESEAILAELGGLGEERPVGSGGLEDDWDQHVNGDLYLPTSSPTCALCYKNFTMDEFVKHYQPLSCRGCRQELCNSEIFALHFHSCREVKHYQSVRRVVEEPAPPPSAVAPSPSLGAPAKESVASTPSKPSGAAKSKKSQVCAS